MIRLICVAIGYLFGCFRQLYLRTHEGNGHPGAWKRKRGSDERPADAGWKAGLITFLGDCFKCVFAVLLVRFLFDVSIE